MPIRISQTEYFKAVAGLIHSGLRIQRNKELNHHYLKSTESQIVFSRRIQPPSI